MPDGTSIVRAKVKPIPDVAGMLKPPKGKHVGVDRMNPWSSGGFAALPWRVQRAQRRARRVTRAIVKPCTRMEKTTTQ